MTVFQSIAISFGGNAEHRDLAAVAHVGEHVAEGRGVAGHLQADVEAFRHAEFLLHVGQRRLADVRRAQVTPILLRQLEAVGVDVRDHDVARAGVRARPPRP